MTVGRRETLVRAAFGSAVLVAAALAGTGCGSDDAAGPEPAAASPQTAAATSEATSAATGADASDSGGPVTQEQAEQAALAAVGQGQVTWSGPEDDRGAAWEIEVTRSDGSEVDVLVAADGSIVKQLDKYTGSAEGGAGTSASGGQVTLQEAERIAVEAVGEGQVTWSGREDERGAAFEIEVTLNDGREVDVLIDASGNVVP